jgi:ADP-ribosylglycohydrolase
VEPAADPLLDPAEGDRLLDKAAGALSGAAVGDALGGPTEGYTPAAIQERHGGLVTGIVGPWFENWRDARPMSPYHKGDGHVTDDTLMTLALVDVYAEVRDHLGAFDIAERLVPKLMNDVRWVPELERDTVILQRIFLAEKWLALRLHYGHVDPREAGVGNVVNCGAAMYMAPVGIVNAGDPDSAYAEAIDMAGAHQSSYGREAAGVYAAAVAEAMRPGATIDSVVDRALAVAHDGTKVALEAVAEVAQRHREHGGDWAAAIGDLREAITPFDTVGPVYREPALDARIPSRTKSIEELPVALGFAIVTGGDVSGAVLGGVNYGRDSDSIATMAGAITGALGGAAAVPGDWVADVSAASRIDPLAAARTMAGVARDVWARDASRADARAAARAGL